MHRWEHGVLSILCVACGFVCCGTAVAQGLRPGGAGAPLRSTAETETGLANSTDVDLLRRLEAVEAELSRIQGGSLPLESASQPLIPACGNCGTWSCGGACEAIGEEKPRFPTVALTGVFHLDGGYYDQSPLNRDVLGDIQDGLGFRRARLAAKGKVSERTSYIMEFDFAQSQARFVDVWMEFEQTPLGNLRIGRFRQPFGMAELTSVRDLPFLERPLPFALSPFRQTGGMLHDTAMGESLTWAVSGYRYLSDNYGNVYADDGGYGLASRLTGLLVDRGDDDLIHLGAGYSYNDPGRDRVQFASTNEFFAGQNPELGPGGLDTLPIVAVPPFVNTGLMPTEHTNLFNLEGAIGRGHWLVQSEARWAAVEMLDGTSNTFPGAYAHVRYVLTGETIPYNRQAGAFGRIQPRNPVNFAQGCWGAWEVAARASYLDLNGDNLPGPGRRLTDTTLGLNWYVNNFTKFQLNWIHSNLDDPIFGSSRADTYAFRGQLDF
ncbi:OprO/OprP family phosphate-selective porin [Candidatus Laterigemmans baculatus]|uniref:OprO/OprP family phosphate-selective porin n=1 Tax=Candidatus Laterigemmans baculatus TaxID=2770505 RepID=UPI0013D8E533|nr:porin [Candidatus Laterigemmans baculatus]